MPSDVLVDAGFACHRLDVALHEIGQPVGFGRENLEVFYRLAILAPWQSGPQIQQAGAMWQIGDFIMASWRSNDELLRNGSIAGVKRERLFRGERPLGLEASTEIHSAERPIRGIPGGAFAL